METPQGISSSVPPMSFASGTILVLGFGVPDGGFERRFGHVVAADGEKDVPNFAGGGEFPALDHGPEEIAQDEPGGVGGFVGIERAFAGGGFAPAGDAVDVGFDQDDAAEFRLAETGFKRREKL